MDSFVDDEWTIEVAGARFPAVVRTPAALADRPALLIHLTLHARHGLDHLPFALVPRAFLAAGHRVASFDLPNHGQRVDAFGEGLVGMAAAMAQGHDVVADAVATGRAFVDAYETRLGQGGGAILASGSSRGGFFALHLLAADRRIAAAAAFAPVTDLPALHEFAALEDVQLVRNAAALSLVPRLADRPVYLCINRDDQRVRTESCLAFHGALRAVAADPSLHTLRLDPGDTHTVSDEAYAEGADWLLGYLGSDVR
jgi:dienelactone hydrolase